MDRPNFSQMLLENNLVTEEQLRFALNIQAQTGELMGSILYKNKILSEEQVINYLSKVYEVPGILISQVSPDPQLKEAIPSKIARSFKILPIELREKVLSVAAANRFDLLAYIAS